MLDATQSFVARLVRFRLAAPRRTCWPATTEASRLFTPAHARPLDVALSEVREAALVFAPSHATARDVWRNEARAKASLFAPMKERDFAVVR